MSNLNGVNLNVAGTGNLIMVPGVLDGAVGVPGAGFGTLRVGIPNVPALSGFQLWGQWLILDGGVPAGASSTRAARIDIF